MNIFSNHKVIIWILAGSLIVILSILGSLIYHTGVESEEVITQAGCSSSCMMLFDELDLDASQQREIENILDQFRDTSATLVSELRQCRLALMEELQNDNPDSLEIILLSEELGSFQARMTMLASSQYLHIKTICTPDQRQKLSNVYCDLFGCPRLEKGQGQGQQRPCRGDQ
ncbi:MAG: periplasmic heavy metal sensor [Bacteroidetes bacterium]|nr:periplasmic heavy metal sensor [Bacteroidota bacterium]